VNFFCNASHTVRHLALFDLIVGSGLLMQQARLPLRQLALIVVRPLCIRNMLLLNQHFFENSPPFLVKNGFVCVYLQESDSVRAGLLMEQAALFLLQIPPPGLRKFAFTMVLAGLKYFQHAQRSLGIRCYM